MVKDWLQISSDKLVESANQTIYMIGWSLFFGMLLAIPLGLAMTLCRKGGLKENLVVFWIINGIVNIVRSVPFVVYSSSDKNCRGNSDWYDCSHCSPGFVYCTLPSSLNRGFFIGSEI